MAQRKELEMIQRMVPVAAFGLLLFGDKLATDYSAARSVRFTSEMSVDTKSTMRMERDGQPVEPQGGMGGGSSSQGRVVTWVDKVLEHKDGAPTKVRRVFGDLKSTMTFMRGDQEQTRDSDGPLAGVTLELSLGSDGKVEAKVVDGKEPQSEALVGHHLALSLDAFLPDGEKAEGDSWDLEKEQINVGLGTDIVQALFPRPPEDASAGGGEGGGRRSRGGSGGFGGGSLLSTAEWEGKATLSDATEEYEGATCKVIKLELEASGDLPEPSFGGGRGRAFEPETAAAFFASTYEIKLEGRLLFDAKAKLPVRLELEGTLKTESSREFPGRDGGSPTKIDSTSEGEVKLEASCAIEKD